MRASAHRANGKPRSNGLPCNAERNVHWILTRLHIERRAERTVTFVDIVTRKIVTAMTSIVRNPCILLTRLRVYISVPPPLNEIQFHLTPNQRGMPAARQRAIVAILEARSQPARHLVDFTDF